MALLFRVVPGSFSVTPTKSSFSVNEPITVRIMCNAEAKRPEVLGTETGFSTVFDVYSKDNRPLLNGDDYSSLRMWKPLTPFANITSVYFDSIAEIAKATTSGTFEGYIVVRCHP